MFCGNCGQEAAGRYCITCGHPTQAGSTPWRGLPAREPDALSEHDLFAPSDRADTVIAQPLAQRQPQRPPQAPPPPSPRPVHSSPPPPPYAVSGSPRRRSAPVTLALVAGLLIGLAGVGGLAVWWQQQGQTSDPNVVAGNTPSPRRVASLPTGSPTTPPPTASATAAAEASPQARLEAWREQGTAGFALDGHWMAQLASKYEGVVDPAQTAADGDHTFGLADIVAEHETLRSRFDNVRLVSGDDFGRRSTTPSTLWVTLYDPGSFGSEAEVRAWCRATFAPLSGAALENVCVPRRATVPHE